MKPAYYFLIGLLLSFGLSGQTLDNNSITVTASRSVDIPAEQAVFGLTVQSDTNIDFNAVQNALRSAGVPGATFSNLSSSTPTILGGGLYWSFTVQTPYAKVNDEFTVLQKAVRTLKAGTPSLTMAFSLVGSSVSDATVQDTQKKLLPDLIADARKRATALADAAGLSVGQVLGITDSTSAISAATSGSAVFSGIISSYYSGSASSTRTVTYLVSVKFAALRYN